MAELDWNLKLVRAREALALLPRKPNSDDEIDWREVDVAHIDTGCTRHPVFGPWSGDQSPFLRPWDGLNLMEKNEAAFDHLDHDGYPGHGTRTASVLCGNLPGRFVGLAPGIPTIPYRAVNSTVLWTKKARNRVARCIRHAVEINACEIVSMSMGFPQMSLFGQRRLGQAVDYAYEEGTILVAAGGQVIDRVTYPGRFSRTIGVGASPRTRRFGSNMTNPWRRIRLTSGRPRTSYIGRTAYLMTGGQSRTTTGRVTERHMGPFT